MLYQRKHIYYVIDEQIANDEQNHYLTQNNFLKIFNPKCK